MPLALSTFKQASSAIEKGDIHALTSLSGSSGALIFSLLKSPSLLLCPSEETAAEFYSDAVFWAKTLGTEEPVLIDTDESPERLKSLHILYERSDRKFIASVRAALLPLWNKSGFSGLPISKGLNIERDLFVLMFQDAGYHTVPIVSGPGEMSIRGGILDIFPPDKEFPVRVEFFGDDIDSIRYFDIETQLTVQEIDEAIIYPALEPQQGPDLIDLLSESLLILCEKDDINSKFPDIAERIENRKSINFTSLPLTDEGPDLKITGTGGLGLLREERAAIEDFVSRIGELSKEFSILMACSSDGQAKRLRDLFTEKDIENPIIENSRALEYPRSPVITIGNLSRGFRCGSSIVLSEADIFGKRPAFRSIKRSKVSKLISSISEIKEGDYVVHIDHGIGKYLGITKQKRNDYEGDFLTLEYLDGDRIYLPLERINCIQKYQTPEHSKPFLDKLGSKRWLKTKQRVQQKIKDMAEKLITLYAQRSSVTGHPFTEDTELHKEFDGFFPYEETPDQARSIAEIKKEMEDPSPMDKLLCGDVGYGKTEVAMRAAFKAVFDSKQVAVLVPTTVLAEQHYNTFTNRFSAFPVKIGMLNRFKSSAEEKATLKALAEGALDIVIGTHKLLGKNINFYDLGLLIIDEEHKFGVTHKEKIKSIKTSVDVLSLTATPIPRTLHMALAGIRGLSIIETPPEERLAVKSFVIKFDPNAIMEAIQYEIDRGGQVFFIHNRIDDIDKMSAYLKGLVPDSKVGVAHGQMHGRELEQVMSAFYRKDTNLLVSTNIIGSGLDIPSANTIIINRADRFGLADLYQLRGRVGRSNVRAYAYFVIPAEDISEDARKKLSAIQELSYLGAGFRLAMKDLEIRGAGNLLGGEQSGHIEAVGFDLYVQMLEEAVSELKGEKQTPKTETVIDLKKTAGIPESYIEDPTVRLSIYKKISSIKKPEDVMLMKDELRDRFGEPPEETLRLIDILELKLLAGQLAITKIENIIGKIRLTFAQESPVTQEKILSLYDKKEKGLKFLPERGIEIDMKGREWSEVYLKLKSIMNNLAE
ncbi:MAG: transcription-repair coupling factor [Thermodesulfovibrionia bacterium]|nr:transcription-repair coupling factor [Thermodesulfovibrionia bacterium]